MFYKGLLLVLGTISLVLGIIGIFVPLLPTTPFLLLTAFLYLKSSPKAYQWLINQKHLGPYIINFQEKKIIPRKTKVYILALLWISIVCCMVFVVDSLWARLLLGAIVIGVTIHILSYKSE
jgi:Uncharacterized protein conserved in bacteria